MFVVAAALLVSLKLFEAFEHGDDDVEDDGEHDNDVVESSGELWHWFDIMLLNVVVVVVVVGSHLIDESFMKQFDRWVLRLADDLVLGKE